MAKISGGTRTVSSATAASSRKTAMLSTQASASGGGVMRQVQHRQ